MYTLIAKLRHILVDDWYIAGDPMSKDRWRLLRAMYTSNTIRALFGGTFWTGMLLCLNADDAFIGTIGMISSAAGMLQILGPFFLEHFAKRKKMLIIMRAILWLFNVVFIGVIPLFPVSHQAMLSLTAMGVVIVNVLNTCVNPGVAIWHTQSIPQKVRSGFYSLFTMTNGALVALVTFLAGLLVDKFDSMGMQYYGLLLLRGIAALLCVFELVMYTKIPEYPYSENPNASFRLRDMIPKAVKEKRYLLTIVVGMMWSLIAGIPGGYYSVYLLSDIKLSYSYISIIGAFNVPIVLLCTPIWKKWLKHFSWFRTLSIAMSAYAVIYLMMAMVTGKTVLWMYPASQILSFFFGIGVSLPLTGIPYANIPKENQTIYYGAYQTACNLAAFVSAAVGKYFVLWVGDRTVTVQGLTLGGKQLVVLLTGALLLAGAFAVNRIRSRMITMNADT